MGHLQIKNLPAELHEGLRERARLEHATVTDVVVRALRRELARPSGGAWIGEVRAAAPQLRRPLSDAELRQVLDEAKDELDGGR